MNENDTSRVDRATVRGAGWRDRSGLWVVSSPRQEPGYQPPGGYFLR
ncbi:MAG TPA: hypothetical protein VF580_15650 [Thermoanaerobaculia bacterium]